MSERTALDVATDLTIAAINKTNSPAFLLINESGGKNVAEFFTTLYKEIEKLTPNN